MVGKRRNRSFAFDRLFGITYKDARVFLCIIVMLLTVGKQDGIHERVSSWVQYVKLMNSVIFPVHDYVRLRINRTVFVGRKHGSNFIASRVTVTCTIVGKVGIEFQKKICSRFQFCYVVEVSIRLSNGIDVMKDLCELKVNSSVKLNGGFV